MKPTPAQLDEAHALMAATENKPGGIPAAMAALIVERDAYKAHAANVVETAGATNAQAMAEVVRLTKRETSLLGYNSRAVEERQEWRIRAEASESLRHDMERRHVQLLTQRHRDRETLLGAGWLIFFRPQRLYWRANANGYTSDVREAGRYTFADAHAKSSSRDKQGDGTYTDAMVPSPELLALLSTALHGDQAIGVAMESAAGPDIVIQVEPRKPSLVEAVNADLARDKCELCRGTKGGEPGNENVYDGPVIACDYCSVLLDKMRTAMEARLVAARPQFVQQLREKADRLEKAIRWALGEVGQFPPMPRKLEGKPRRNYWWRTELRARAGL